MPSFFVRRGNTFKVSSKENLDICEKLPVGAYNVQLDDQCGQFYLDKIDGFDIKHKLYGSTTRHCDRILQTFLDRPSATGVLLSGEKGSGKTLLAKHIAITAASQHKIPTIVVNKNWCGEEFNAFLQSIEQPAIVLFDEFEKVYCDGQDQDKLLTLLDGVYPSKKLYILTCNDTNMLTENLQNRPGRLFYALEFEGLDSEFIRDYCEDNLRNKDHIPKVCAIADVFSTFNFDMLKAMVEEMNRYNETPSEVLKYLNVKLRFESALQYHVKIKVRGVQLSNAENNVQSLWRGYPLQETVRISYEEVDPENPDNRKRKRVEFLPQDLEHMADKSFVFANKKADCHVMLTPVRDRFVDFDLGDSVVAKQGDTDAEKNKKTTFEESSEASDPHPFW